MLFLVIERFKQPDLAVAPYKLLPPVIDAVKQVVRARLLLFNSTAGNRSAAAS